MVSFTASFIVVTLFIVSFARGTFIQPEPLIQNLSLWASVQADQVCGGNCYNSFQNVSCKDSRVCIDRCNGRDGLPAVEHPLSDWSLEKNNDGCSVRGKDTPSSPSTVFATDTDDRMLFVNGSSDSLSPCYSQRNNSVDRLFTLTFWIIADCQNWWVQLESCSYFCMCTISFRFMHIDYIIDIQWFFRIVTPVIVIIISVSQWLMYHRIDLCPLFTYSISINSYECLYNVFLMPFMNAFFSFA